MSEGQCQYANNTIFLTYMSPSCRYVLCCIANVFHSTKETIQKIIRTNLLYSDSAFLITKRWEAGWWRVGGQLATMFYVKQSPVLGWAGLAAVITPSICPHLSHSLTPTSTNRCRIGRASSDLFVQHDTLHLMIDTHKTHCSQNISTRYGQIVPMALTNWLLKIL